ncbi:DUF4351 domain-containing protein [Achromobacter sp. F4_2707]|uniref:DUF4351 domain-containing protein n=1 Tax=Achromobacter sp. F4_2707 TaxID=3114286 RepID=UPI0039C5C35F
MPVLPIVLYNGNGRWTAATDISDLIPRAPGLVAHYLPKLKYLLIDENQFNSADLKPMRNLVAAIIQAERPESNESLLQLIDLLNGLLANHPELRRTFAIWMRAVVLRQSRHTLALPKMRDLKELKMTLAERFDAWALQHEERGMRKGIEQGIKRGIEKGIQKGLKTGIIQGEALVLQRLLAKRFGPLSPEAIQTIATANSEQIDTWLDRLFDANCVEDVLRG